MGGLPRIVLEPLAQRRAGAGEPRFHRAHRAAHHLRPLALGEPLEGEEHHGTSPRPPPPPPPSGARQSRRPPPTPPVAGVAATRGSTVSSAPTTGLPRWRRYCDRNAFRRIRNSQALRFVPGVYWSAG